MLLECLSFRHVPKFLQGHQHLLKRGPKEEEPTLESGPEEAGTDSDAEHDEVCEPVEWSSKHCCGGTQSWQALLRTTSLSARSMRGDKKGQHLGGKALAHALPQFRVWVDLRGAAADTGLLA